MFPICWIYPGALLSAFFDAQLQSAQFWIKQHLETKITCTWHKLTETILFINIPNCCRSELVYSTWWKFSLHIVCIFRTVWNFLVKFWNSDQGFTRSILTPFWLKFEISAHAQITITRYDILFKNFTWKKVTWFFLKTCFDPSLTYSLFDKFIAYDTLSFWLVWRVTFKVWSCTAESTSSKSHVTTFITSSVDPSMISSM